MSTVDVNAKYNAVKSKYQHYFKSILATQKEFQNIYQDVVNRVVTSFSFDPVNYVKKHMFSKIMMYERTGYTAPEYKPPRLTLNYLGGTTTYDGKEGPTMPIFSFDPNLYNFGNIESASLVALGGFFLAMLDKTHPDAADYENARFKFHRLGFYDMKENSTSTVPTDMEIFDPAANVIASIAANTQITNATGILYTKTLSNGALYMWITSGTVEAKAVSVSTFSVSTATYKMNIIVVTLSAIGEVFNYVRGLRFLDQSCSGQQIAAILQRGYSYEIKLTCATF